jgi:hypothetical protein
MLNSLHLSFILINMRNFSNSTVTSTSSQVSIDFHNGIRGQGIFYASAAVALTAVLLSGFEAGRKVLLRILWFFDGMLGGAPHSVTLPGPPGLPIIGNLFEVGFLCD